MESRGCNASTLILYSELCLSDEPPDDCYPTQGRGSGAIWSAVAVIFEVVNLVVGVFGNLLTLLAIPYAKYHRRFGFKSNRNTASLYIMNLACADFLYCIVVTPAHLLHYFSQGWPFSLALCTASVVIRWSLVFISWLSLALIAFSRYVVLSHPKVGKALFGGRLAWLPIVFVWSMALSSILPILDEDFGIYGYNCMRGVCSLIQTGDIPLVPKLALLLITFLLPLITLVLSNVAIWRMARESSHYLRKSSSHIQNAISARDQRLTTMVCRICLCYMLANLPMMGINISGKQHDWPTAWYICEVLYWTQYSMNFIIYAASNKQYREAYLMFLREAVCRLDRDPMESSAGGGGGGGVVVIRGDAAAPVASSSSDQRGKRRRRLRLSVQEAPEGTPSKHSSRSKSLQDDDSRDNGAAGTRLLLRNAAEARKKRASSIGRERPLRGFCSQ